MGGEPDDREKLQRYQGYSINLGGRSYTLDWLAPEALPVFVGVMFTLLHAAIQTYVLTTLVSIFYGEAVEPNPKKIKEKKA